MDENLKEKMKKMLESGEITQEIYKEIMDRWNNNETGSDDEREKQSSPGDSNRKSDSVISISGSGELPQAIAHELKISGSGRITGPVDVDKFSSSGSARVEGDIVAKEQLTVSGSLRTSGKVEADSIRVSGGMKSGEIICRKLDNSGSAAIDGDLTAESADVSGSLHVNNVKCTDLDVSGSFNAEDVTGERISISGEIRAENVKAESFALEAWASDSRISKLESNTVKVNTKRRLFPSRRSVRIGEIKAESVDIENVRSEKVIAGEAIIGDDCEIDYLEARVIKISDRARVREKKIVDD